MNQTLEKTFDNYKTIDPPTLNWIYLPEVQLSSGGFRVVTDLRKEMMS